MGVRDLNTLTQLVYVKLDRFSLQIGHEINSRRNFQFFDPDGILDEYVTGEKALSGEEGVKGNKTYLDT